MSTFEEEVLEALADEANTVPYKDVVFAQLSFRLKQGTLKLYSRRRKSSNPKKKKMADKGSHLFEFEFNEVKVECETRPRTRSYKFGLTLGGMYLRDMITPNSIFPLLVSPQNTQGMLAEKTKKCMESGKNLFTSRE